MRILLTRPLEASKKVARNLAEFGIETIISPVISITPRTLDAFEDSRYQAILVTSGNTALAVRRSEFDKKVPVYCVGDETAAQYRQLGFEEIFSASGNAQNLVELVTHQLHPEKGPLLYLSGNIIANDLDKKLMRLGFSVAKKVVYSACAEESLNQETVSALKHERIHGVLFFSARSAEVFVKLLKNTNLQMVTEKMVAYCISKAAANKADRLVWRKIIVAKRPNQSDLLSVLVE